jgi:hypothetical protein
MKLFFKRKKKKLQTSCIADGQDVDNKSSHHKPQNNKKN